MGPLPKFPSRARRQYKQYMLKSSGGKKNVCFFFLFGVFLAHDFCFSILILLQHPFKHPSQQPLKLVIVEAIL